MLAAIGLMPPLAVAQGGAIDEPTLPAPFFTAQVADVATLPMHVQNLRIHRDRSDLFFDRLGQCPDMRGLSIDGTEKPGWSAASMMGLDQLPLLEVLELTVGPSWGSNTCACSVEPLLCAT